MTYQEFLNIDTTSGKRSFIYATDMENVVSCGFTGEDFGGGRALLIDMTGVGTAAMSISESGVQVTS